MRLAYEQVVSNDGAPGVDGLHVDELYAYLQTHWGLTSPQYCPVVIARTQSNGC